MNADEMMAALDRRAEDEKSKKEQIAARRRSEMLADCNRAAENLHKIVEVRGVVMRLFKECLVPSHGFMNHSFDFLTDGIEHGLGFFRVGHGDINFSRFGIEGGGAWYNSVCVNIDTGLWSQRTEFKDWDPFLPAEEFVVNSHVEYEHYHPISKCNYDCLEVTNKVKGIANGIDRFVESVEAFVRKISK